MENNKYTWTEYYMEFARILLTYEDKRKILADKVMQIYQKSGLSAPTLDINNELEDMDPFTVFAIFNKSSQKTDNRLLLLKTISDLFGVTSPIPQNFDGLPADCGADRPPLRS